MIRLHHCIICLSLIVADCAAQEASSKPEWRWLQNAQIKIGVDLNAGACIGWLSTAAQPERNLLDTYDRGRYVQQSYYGDEDGSDWNGKPWRYNPVQGGDWKGQPARVAELKQESATSLFAKTLPRHWANGRLMEEVTMEQWLTLDGDLLHVKFRMSYGGAALHKAHHQELPAFFVRPEFDTLVLCETAPALSRQQPGEKNEYFTLAEPWVAWVDKGGFAVGVLSQGAKRVTCYRVPGPAACSYVAPIGTFALTPGLVFEYQAWIGAAPLDALVARFRALPQGR